MCGINGIVSLNQNYSVKGFEGKVRIMNSNIVHRGPDSMGMFSDDNVVLGFQRLSIIDLSSDANQPMSSIDDNITIVFNGEIYNYIEIQNELIKKGYSFRTKSDTEVIINAYKEWGNDCIQKFNGMWAFAIYDFKKQLLFLSRDRLGVKPLYYHLNPNYLIFSSETKSIKKVEELYSANRNKAYEYLAYGYNKTNDGETFIDGINELLPGTNLIVQFGKIRTEKYWSLSLNKYKFHDFNEASEFLFMLFEDAIGIRYRSDVPVGLLLSGGLDSSVIAKMTDNMINEGKINQTKINAYTAHFPQYEKDEYKYAESFANTLKNIELKAVEPNINEVLGNFESIIYGFDQPVFSFNTIVHYLLLKEVHTDGIKVAMNGQGADEAFYGYDRYLMGYFLWDRLLEGKSNFFTQLKSIHNNCGYTYLEIFKQLYKATLTKKTASYYRAKFGEKIIECLDKKFVDNGFNHFNNDYKFSVKGSNLVNYSIEHITNTGLNTILHYEDISSMLNSVEMRSPFLDYRVMEFAFSIPDDYKYNKGLTKRIIRESLGKTLPNNISKNYKKLGFETPFNKYMKEKAFNEFINDTFRSKNFDEKNIWCSKSIIKKFSNIDDNKEFPFWRILNFEIWSKVNSVTGL